MTVILTTTGISLKLNAERAVGAPASDDQILHYLNANPSQASAELNALLRFAASADQLVLLHTKTPDAERCARLLREYLITKGFQHTRLVQLDLQDQPEHLETRGLRSLVAVLIQEIEQAQRRREAVVINATAGLKAQVVYSTMLGMIYQVPVKYIYEGFQRLVTFNPIPLDWNTDVILSNLVFFDWLDAEPRRQEDVRSRLEALPDRERIEAMLADPEPDGTVLLSPMGEALFRHFRREVEKADLAPQPDASPRKPSEKIASTIKHKKHHFPRRLFEQCTRIAALDAVHEIISEFFEPPTIARVKRVEADGTIRLLLSDTEKAANIVVLTTARGQAQTLKIAGQIRMQLGI